CLYYSDITIYGQEWLQVGGRGRPPLRENSGGRGRPPHTIFSGRDDSEMGREVLTYWNSGRFGKFLAALPFGTVNKFLESRTGTLFNFDLLETLVSIMRMSARDAHPCRPLGEFLSPKVRQSVFDVVVRGTFAVWVRPALNVFPFESQNSGRRTPAWTCYLE